MIKKQKNEESENISKNQSMTEEMENMKEKCMKYEKNTTELQDELQKKENELTQQIDTLKSSISDKDNKINELKTDIANNDREKEELTNQCNELKNRIEVKKL